MKETSEHGWPKPEEGDQYYENIFDELIDAIDREALLITDSLPDDNVEDRWFIRTSDRALFYDDGVGFNKIEPERVLPDRIGARVDQSEAIGAQWTFNQDIIADLDGEAEYAEMVDSVNDAKDSKTVMHYTAEDLCQKDDTRNITGQWSFAVKINVKTLNITDDTFKLPRHG